MTIIAARSAVAPLEKNRLDASAIFLEVERRLRWRACRRLL
jgi:hypothetical protein